ncbi:head decoration protein [Marinobacterium sp. D7]|uniref:head decoration protein n=1 Tax=Marinobacterium ramblicola TaxID=2849041 RepID=UPI001C2D5372|nr:head decoration protein [Marinobacterium ramblicola]MBV1788623.1 head decoration protein [Marinobacterium ramblicola]
MTVKTMDLPAGAFLSSSTARSINTVTIQQGQILNAGHVLGEVLNTTITATAATGNTGDGTVTGLSTVTGLKKGTYDLTIIQKAPDGGQFQLRDPRGKVVGFGVVGVAFVEAGLSFTLQDGSTDFVLGDRFTIEVESTGKVIEWNPGNTDGSDTPAGILFAAIDATDQDRKGVMVSREASVITADLSFFDGATPDDIQAAGESLALHKIDLLS